MRSSQYALTTRRNKENRVTNSSALEQRLNGHLALAAVQKQKLEEAEQTISCLRGECSRLRYEMSGAQESAESYGRHTYGFVVMGRYP